MSGETISGIRRRIKGIKNAQKIAKAMFLSASVKYSRAVKAMEASRSFKIHAQKVMEILASHLAAGENAGKSCDVIVAGDRGMSGGYNSAVLKTACMHKAGCRLAIGKKAYERLRANAEMISAGAVSSEKLSFEELRGYADKIVRRLRNGEISTVSVIYTSFSGKINTEEIIATKKCPQNETMIYEPGAEEILDRCLSDLLAGVIYADVCEANAREQLSRRIAMDAAQKNAAEMLENLQLTLNRKRQSGITQEIIEAVSGYTGEMG